MPQALLLVSEVDLVDPAAWTAPVWAEGFAAPGERLVVDGSSDQGVPTALTGEVLPYEGERNGELVQLSAEPEVWTHFAGSPVSRDGRLAGIVHTVMTDRMVFLTGQALREQAGFREVMAAHARGGNEETGVCLAVRPRVFLGPRGRGVGQAVDELLMEAMADSGVSGVVAPGEKGLHTVVVADPGALGKAGLLLSALPAALSRLRAGSGEWEVALAVALARGAFTVDGEGVHGPAADEAGRLVGHPEVVGRMDRSGARGAVVVVAGESLGGVEGLDLQVDVRLGPEPEPEGPGEPLATAGQRTDATAGPGTGAARGPAGWICLNGPVEMARVLIGADLMTEDPAVDWTPCGYGATEADPTGCIGIRLPRRGRCLAHATRSEQDEYLRNLRPGRDVDLRGTTFADGLLERVLRYLRDRQTGHVRMGVAAFDRAHFVDEWSTVGAEFEERVSFDRAVFDDRAGFATSHFRGTASFGRTVFRRGGAFDGSTFDREARFTMVDFGGNADFADALFVQDLAMTWALLSHRTLMSGMRVRGTADFAYTVFHGPAVWDRAAFLRSASFTNTLWGRPVMFDEVRFEGRASFDHATFGAPAVFQGTVFADRATFAEVDFADYGEFTDTTFTDPAGLPGAWLPLLPSSGAATFRLGGAGGGATTRL